MTRFIRVEGLIVSLSVLVMAGNGYGGTPQVTPKMSTATAIVAIQTSINGLFVSLRDDTTLVPQSATIGARERFELYEFGKGIALKSIANGKYVSARRPGPLLADSESIGEDQTFRVVGGGQGFDRLRSVRSRTFVCASDAGGSALSAQHGCPHEWQMLRFERVEMTTFAITSPAANSSFRTTAVTFEWEAGGEEHWLTIGTAPGGSDIYVSASLGSATRHTVSGLPLNGATLYVNVRRRIGMMEQTAEAQYTAAIRKGLAVITDFANRRLEDWTGAGIRTPDDLSVQLRGMQDHWNWLSRGLERMQWDVIRIQLAQPVVPDAYPNWPAFRDAAITLAKEQVQTADYDVNGDEVIDAVWLIVSSGDSDTGDYAIGGMSRNAGANLFVDGQASGSVTAGAIGNFNHELGHCLGLPDMYGAFDSVHTLTLMSFSWPVPPPDFTAYERVKLGWLKPQVVTQTTSGLWLPTNDTMAGVMIPTANPSEYFLIEYRRRPATGYGSIDPAYNGLAVYHVLEGSSMSLDPPLMKLEPADGQIIPGNYPIDPNDFVSPDNPYLVSPMVLYSYYGERQEVLRIHNVAWKGDGLTFDVTIPAMQQPSVNLLLNGSFETGQGSSPDAWVPGSYVPMPGGFVWPDRDATDGQFSAKLISTGNDMWWSQAVRLVPEESYEFCGSLKGEAIAGGSTGGNLSVLGGWIATESLLGTFDWTRKCVRFSAPAATVEVACRLGFYASTVTGTLRCDGLTLEHLRTAF